MDNSIDHQLTVVAPVSQLIPQFPPSTTEPSRSPTARLVGSVNWIAGGFDDIVVIHAAISDAIDHTLAVVHDIKANANCVIVELA